MKRKILAKALFFLLLVVFVASNVSAYVLGENKEASKKQEQEKLQEQFQWWPTDAQPAPVKDGTRGGYWWWPKAPGSATPWGNRGYIYLYKIIYDYKDVSADQNLKPSLLIKKIIKNVKVYFDFDKADLRDDAQAILEAAVRTLKRNPDADILITGNCDMRGKESYNIKLGERRAEGVKDFMLNKGIDENRIKIVSRGKLDAAAPITDLVGLQKDRNAQFMIAEVEEIEIPAPPAEAKSVEEGKYMEEQKEEMASEVKVSTKEYTVQKNDTLWKIAAKEYSDGKQWRRIYNFNKDRIKNPSRLLPGQKIILPIE
ncbi:MAG: OmpA family protein [Candidatus Omnitrophica bacterium]|nr:OmpA family protein [Candidatus Omnitrophota bacterium]